MKRTILAIALTSILAACGSASNSQPEAPVIPVAQQEQQQPASTELPPTVLAQVEQAPDVKPESQPEHQKLDPAAQSDYLDPMSDKTGLPFEAPKAEEEPIGEWEAKYLHAGVVRAIVEYKMVGEDLKFDLAKEMGQGVDAWIKLEAERCTEDAVAALRTYSDGKRASVKAMCTGQAYGYWALVNGVTERTLGTPRQCLERGYCGFIFRQYDVTTTEPLISPMNGLDTEF